MKYITLLLITISFYTFAADGDGGNSNQSNEAMQTYVTCYELKADGDGGNSDKSNKLSCSLIELKSGTLINTWLEDK